jgi:hypothetical protein
VKLPAGLQADIEAGKHRKKLRADVEAVLDTSPKDPILASAPVRWKVVNDGHRDVSAIVRGIFVHPGKKAAHTLDAARRLHAAGFKCGAVSPERGQIFHISGTRRRRRRSA